MSKVFDCRGVGTEYNVCARHARWTFNWVWSIYRVEIGVSWYWERMNERTNGLSWLRGYLFFLMDGNGIGRLLLLLLQEI